MKYMKTITAILILVMSTCPWVLGETIAQTDGLVEFSVKEKGAYCSALDSIQVVPKGFRLEDVMTTFSILSENAENLSVYKDGFAYESTLGLALSDALYMVDHENLDQLNSFDLPFMPIEEACEYVVSCFSTLGISVAIETAYAIDSSEYDRLYNSHIEWIADMGRDKRNWSDEDNSYVIYLNQEYEGIHVYPGFFWYEEIVNNYPGTEIVVFLSERGFEYISCAWSTAMTSYFQLDNVMDFETAENVFTEEYNNLLTLNPKHIIVYEADLVYMTFEDEDSYVLRPYWVFRAKMENGERRDYILNAVDRELFGL